MPFQAFVEMYAGEKVHVCIEAFQFFWAFAETENKSDKKEMLSHI